MLKNMIFGAAFIGTVVVLALELREQERVNKELRHHLHETLNRETVLRTYRQFQFN